ncbi:hypothetical protein D3C74_373640 [compost metagenome]
MALGECKYKNCLCKIGLALGILPDQQVYGTKRVQSQMFIIAEILQINAVHKHAVTSLLSRPSGGSRIELVFLFCGNFECAFSVHFNDIPRV